MKARAGTEIVFRGEGGREMKGRVQDYSLGGVAFVTEENLALKPDDSLQELSLRIPRAGGLRVDIPLALVRRVEAMEQEGKNLYALEFIGLEESIKDRFRQHISETQRLLLRKFKAGPPSGGGQKDVGGPDSAQGPA